MPGLNSSMGTEAQIAQSDLEKLGLICSIPFEFSKKLSKITPKSDKNVLNTSNKPLPGLNSRSSLSLRKQRNPTRSVSPGLSSSNNGGVLFSVQVDFDGRDSKIRVVSDYNKNSIGKKKVRRIIQRYRTRRTRYRRKLSPHSATDSDDEDFVPSRSMLRFSKRATRRTRNGVYRR